MNPDIVFFSRGRGKGHAIPDLSIARTIRELSMDLDIRFASYGTGYSVLSAFNERAHDLQLPDANPFCETLIRCGQLLKQWTPRLVVSHEELAVIPAAHLLGLPTLYLTHWFPSSSHPYADALDQVDLIVFLERRGLFPEPLSLTGRVEYVGPLMRSINYLPVHREKARFELGLPLDSAVILILPGSPSEELVPICSLVLGAFALVENNNKQLIWVAGVDYAKVCEMTNGQGNIRVLDTDWHLDRLMVACDVAITKGTYNIGRELTALGIPSISLSNGHNFIDDLFSRSFQTNVFLWTKETTSAILADLIHRALKGGPFEPDLCALEGEATASVARRVVSCLAAGSGPT